MLKNKEWFGEWFDSPYYHILYRHRDEEEARSFIDRLSAYLQLSRDHKILDLACGKGRHSIYLNQQGYEVVGLDLSPQNIAFARRFENDRLKFYVHDMRNTWTEDQFDYIFNLFTSFGYFETDEEHERAIYATGKSLKDEGKILIDFLNPYTVIHNLVPEEEKTIKGINFRIRKYLSTDQYIIKEIQFEDKGMKYDFKEKVKAIRRVKFLNYFEKAGLKLLDIFGDYDLNPYIAEKSERMIFLLNK
jgi:SAM-dependent methyltransferase